MPRHSPHDESVERMLREILTPSAAPRSPVGGCVDGEMLAAWTSGKLAPMDAASLEAHCSVCPRCQELLATFARTRAAAGPSRSPWTRSYLRWLVPLAAAGAAVAIWIAVPAPTRPTSPSAELSLQSKPSTSLQSAPSSIAPTAPESAAAGAGTASDTDASQQAAVKEARGAATGNAGLVEREENTAAPSPELDQLARLDAPSSPRAAASSLEVQQTAPPAEAPAAAAAPPSALGETATRAARSDAALRRETPSVVDIVSPTPAVRWRILPTGSVERTADGGGRWEPVTLPAPGGALVAGSSPGPSTCWLVGRSGAIRLTTDGVRFFAVPFPEPVDLVSIRASSDAIAVVTTSDGRQFRTGDQGRTWTRMP